VWVNAAFAVYVALAAFALIGPGYAWWGNKIEPYVLGLPFSFAWVALWAMATFVVLALYHALSGGRR